MLDQIPRKARPTPHMSYRIQITDVPRAADVLSASFIDYPIFEHVIPDRARRRRQLVHVFRFLVRMGLAHGEVLAPSGRIEGVSLWSPRSRASTD